MKFVYSSKQKKIKSDEHYISLHAPLLITDTGEKISTMSVKDVIQLQHPIALCIPLKSWKHAYCST